MIENTGKRLPWAYSFDQGKLASHRKNRSNLQKTNKLDTARINGKAELKQMSQYQLRAF